MNRLEMQMNFIKELDKIKNIQRQTYLADGLRKENDAEHSWHLALMCMVLGEYANEEIDLLKTISMVLIHDVVEIDAGDTYAYDEKGNQTKRQREEDAAKRIFSLLPKEQGMYMRQLWDEFEEANSPEAKFARTVDNLQPIMLNDASHGKAWEEHGVKVSQVLRRNEISPQGSKVLWEYGKNTYIEPNVRKGKIKEDRKG